MILLSKKIYDFYPTILIVDSGIGGLYIYKKINKLLPNYNYIYVFDNLCFPYGKKTESFILERILNIIDVVIRKYFFQISLIVIACNTASIVALDVLKNQFKLPIIGIVPAIKNASKLTKNKIIGILATQLTIKSFYIYNLYKQFSDKCIIKMLGLNDLVILAENKLQGKLIKLSDLYHILKPWLNLHELPDTIILGCTHFSFFKSELKQLFPYKTQFIDSSSDIAYQVSILLNKKFPNISMKKKKIYNNNIAFCTSLNYQSLKLFPILKMNKLFILKQLFI